MKERLVKIETAKLAKEKGFSIGSPSSYCQYHSDYDYDGNSSHRESHKKEDVSLDYSFYTINNNKTIDLSCESYTIWEAPTQAVLQQWLWETHKIWVEITLWGDGIGFTCILKQVQGKAENDTTIVKMVGAVDGGLPTGEPFMLLEKGLVEALNLLEDEDR